MNRYWYTFFSIVIIVVMAIGYRIVTFDQFQSDNQLVITFQHHDHRLEGTLILPHKDMPPNAIVLLIHGDGPQDRWSNQGYIPLVNHLLSKNIAVFSWDKQGVGASSGNWLAQTMDDRANQSIAAYNAVKKVDSLANVPIGFLGFSQAGWAIPKIVTQIKPDFSIIVGAAINWREQGHYFTRQNLMSQGASEHQIDQIILADDIVDNQKLLAYNEVIPCDSTCTREDFEIKNALSDSKQEIPFINTPMMILMGQDDLNVNANETVATWRSLLPKETLQCIRLIPNATHGLLRANLFNYQLESQWPMWKQGLFMTLGQDAYAPQSLNYLSEWILNQTCR